MFAVLIQNGRDMDCCNYDDIEGLGFLKRKARKMANQGKAIRLIKTVRIPTCLACLERDDGVVVEIPWGFFYDDDFYDGCQDEFDEDEFERTI